MNNFCHGKTNLLVNLSLVNSSLVNLIYLYIFTTLPSCWRTMFSPFCRSCILLLFKSYTAAGIFVAVEFDAFQIEGLSFVYAELDFYFPCHITFKRVVSALGAYCFFDNKPKALQGYCIEDTKQLSLF